MHNEKRRVLSMVLIPLPLSTREFKCVMNGTAWPTALVIFLIMIKNGKKPTKKHQTKQYISFSK